MLPVLDAESIHGEISTNMDELAAAIVRHGGAVLRGALPIEPLTAEITRRRTDLPHIEAIHARHGQSIATKLSMDGVQLRVDDVSVVCHDKRTNPELTSAIFRLLARLRRELAPARTAEPARAARFDAFVNYYFRSESGRLVGEHVDKSTLTALTAAVCLRSPSLMPVSGLECWHSSTAAFEPLVPAQINDLILMCGGGAAQLGLPGLLHRVSRGIDADRRFTMVFKLL